jgi:hypothetical protein
VRGVEGKSAHASNLEAVKQEAATYFPNWNSLHVTIPDSFRTAPSHPRMSLHILRKRLMKLLK